MKNKVRFGVFNTLAAVLTAIFWVLLRLPWPARNRVVDVIDSWGDGSFVQSAVKYFAAANLQKALAEATGRTICCYCHWTEQQNFPHKYCREELSKRPCPKCQTLLLPGETCQTCVEIDKAWKEFNAEQDARVRKEEAACWREFELEEGPQY